MYYPILRGKQFELIALRELAKIISPEHLCPVIEPVRGNTSPLIKTLETLHESGFTPLVIINPNLGDFSKGGSELHQLFTDGIKFTPCVKIKKESDLSILSEYDISLDNTAIFTQDGLDKNLVAKLKQAKCVLVNKSRIHPGALSQLDNVILYGDFFDKKSRNADYEEESFYSTLHTEWRSYSNVIGFGDYTIISEEYIESGGPAYVVTIHLSYINRNEFDTMYVRHFSSFNDESPANPGGKFKSALEKVCEYINHNKYAYDDTEGLRELLNLQGNPFPGLGQVKKYSMKHHIETTCNFVRGA